MVSAAPGGGTCLATLAMVTQSVDSAEYVQERWERSPHWERVGCFVDRESMDRLAGLVHLHHAVGRGPNSEGSPAPGQALAPPGETGSERRRVGVCCADLRDCWWMKSEWHGRSQQVIVSSHYEEMQCPTRSPSSWRACYPLGLWFARAGSVRICHQQMCARSQILVSTYHALTEALHGETCPMERRSRATQCGPAREGAQPCSRLLAVDGRWTARFEVT
jgi:hypothetical protein